MYGLPQAGSLAKKLIQKILVEYGFIPTLRTPGMWLHETRPIKSDLVLDGFGVEYERKEETQYLLDVFNTHYRAVEED